MKIIRVVSIIRWYIYLIKNKLNNRLFPYNPENNITSVIKRVKQYYKIKIANSTVTEFIKVNPNFPTLKCICDFFDEFNIQYLAIKLDEQEVLNLGYPFIAHLKEKGGKVIFIYSIVKGSVTYSDTLHSKKMMSWEDFLKKWSKAVLIIAPDIYSGDTNFSRTRKNEIISKSIIPLSILSFILIMFHGLYNKSYTPNLENNTEKNYIYILHLIGFIFSAILFRYGLKLKTNFMDKLCSIQSKISCKEVSESKAGTIFGYLGWSEIGMIYFAGGLASQFLMPFDIYFILLSILSKFAVTFSVFSILYQWITVKKWCLLCLTVQLVLIIEFFLLFDNKTPLDHSLISGLPLLMVCFFICYIIILQFKHIITIKKEKLETKSELLKFKQNHDLFLNEIKQSPYTHFHLNSNAFAMGDLNSNVHIVAFLSLYCSACSSRFKELFTIIKTNRKVRVHFVFSSPKDEHSLKVMNLYITKALTGNETEALELLDEWYKTNKKKKKDMIKKYGTIEEPKDFNILMEYNKNLFLTGKISKVPTVFVNGYLLNKTYTINDIKYHTKELEKITLKKEVQDIKKTTINLPLK